MFPRIASRNPMESLNPKTNTNNDAREPQPGGRRKQVLSKRITRVGGSNIFYVHPYLGKIPILTNIFQRGFNHQLDHHLKQPTSGFWCFCCFHKAQLSHLNDPLEDDPNLVVRMQPPFEDWRN